jgi:hypothetical protein
MHMQLEILSILREIDSKIYGPALAHGHAHGLGTANGSFFDGYIWAVLVVVAIYLPQNEPYQLHKTMYYASLATEKRKFA